MIEFAIVILASRYSTLMKKKKEENDIKKAAKFSAKILSTTKFQPEWAKEEEKRKYRITIPPTHVLDAIAFLVHILSFVIFNVSYLCKNLK